MELVVSDVVYRKKVETNMEVGKSAITHSSVMDIWSPATTLSESGGYISYNIHIYVCAYLYYNIYVYILNSWNEFWKIVWDP